MVRQMTEREAVAVCGDSSGNAKAVQVCVGVDTCCHRNASRPEIHPPLRKSHYLMHHQPHGRRAATRQEKQPHGKGRSQHAWLTSDHADVADVKLDVLNHLPGLELDLHGVVHFDERVRVADGAAVVGGDVGDAAVADLLVSHAAQLVLRGGGRGAGKKREIGGKVEEWGRRAKGGKEQG